MAYDKIIPVRSRLDSCLRYVQNPDKTTLEEAVFQTAIHCRLDTAFHDMQATKSRWGKTGGVQGYHLIHSYAPCEVTPEQAHRLGVEFANKLLADRYEAVVSTHVDQQHLHCHIVFNSVSFVDGRKYQNSFKDYFGDIRSKSNEVSIQNGLSTITPRGSGKHYAEVRAERQGRPTIRAAIRKDIDEIIAQSFTYKTFLEQLRRRGYTVKCGGNVTYTAIRPPGGSRFIRLNSLGDGYTEQEIKDRLSNSRSVPKFKTSRKRHYRVYGWRNRVRKQHGFRTLYFHYVYLLSGRRKYRIASSPMVLQEVDKLQQYQRQFRFLQTYRIDTEEQLSMMADALQNEIDCLTAERRPLYKEKDIDVSAEISRLTSRIRQLRTDLRMCRKIEETIPTIQLHAEEHVNRSQPTQCRKEEKRHERSQ